MSLIFLKRQTKKACREKFFVFFFFFFPSEEVFLSLRQKRKINHTLTEKRTEILLKKKKTKTTIRYTKNESDGVIGVEMARAKHGPDMFRQSGRRGRIRLFPTSLGAGDAHVYIENDSRENATRTETIGRTGSIFSARD